MSKALSAVLTAILISSFVLNSSAQRSRVSESKLQQTSAKATTFANVSAFSDGRAVWLTWDMEIEVGNIGFYVYRVSSEGVELLTPVKMIPGAASRFRGVPEYAQTYYFYDREAKGTSTYFVESLSTKGQRVRTQPVAPRFVPDLPAFTGMTQEEMEVRGGRFRPTTLEDSEPKFTKDIAAEIEEYRQLADNPTHLMVISQPGVARIGVRKAGLYRVPRADLAAAGFDVNTDPGLWQLYLEGVQQAIIVGPNGDYIEFYGTGVDTFETDIRQYYLMNGTVAGKRMETRTARVSTSTVIFPSYEQTFVKKERIEFQEAIFNGDSENYFGRGISSSLTSPMAFTLNNIDFSQPNTTMQLTFQGFSDVLHLIEPQLNGQALAPASGFDLENFTGTYVIPTSLLLEGANSIRFRAIGPTGDFAFFDTMRITFPHKYVAEQNSIQFYTHNNRIAKLDGFSSGNVRVFDTTRDGNFVLMSNLVFQQNGSTWGTNMPAARGRSFFAVEDSAILAPYSVTPNNPDLIGSQSNNANLVIISHKDLMTEAQAWGAYRQSQGISVKVIEVSEIYDEFNYGVISSNSIKNFLQHAYQNWQSAPQYVMLVGDSSWDGRNYEGEGFWNMVPAKMVATVYMETASDDALADFDGDGLTEVPIGRIPGRTPTDITTVFNKTMSWEASVTPSSMTDRGALFAYDHNVGYNFDTMSNVLRAEMPGTPSTFVYRGEVNANTNLINAMSTGKFIVNYSGHGSAGSWGGNPLFFNVFSVPLPTDHNASIYTMLTCLNGYYHWLYNPSISEVLLNTPNKGAVVAWASTGKTLPNYQQAMATRFYDKLDSGTIPRIGDLVRDAKLALVFPFDSPDVRLSWVLLGDPMLKVRPAATPAK